MENTTINIEISGTFFDISKTPEHKKELFFITENGLFRGEYHLNGWFYAYGNCGSIIEMALSLKSSPGFMSFNELPKTKCLFWQYCEDIKINYSI